MTTSCPYCGATLNLNYCVVCGRQSTQSSNKMGSLKAVARNTDVTKRLEDPLQLKKYNRQQFFKRLSRACLLLLKVCLGLIVIVALIATVTNQAIYLSVVAPWMKSHRIAFPNQGDLDHLKESMSRFAVTKQKPTADKTKHKTENQKAKASSK